MQKPTFSNEKITSENAYLRTIQRDFVDSQGRAGNIIVMEGVHGKGGSFIFALTQDKKVILNREYKFGPDDFIYTFPSGFIEIEDSKQNALNEFEEETGYSSDKNLIYIGEVILNSYIAGKAKFYFVDNCYRKYEKNTHEGEEIETHLVSLEEMYTMVMNNEILEPCTLVNYFFVKEKTNNFTNFDF